MLGLLGVLQRLQLLGAALQARPLLFVPVHCLGRPASLLSVQPGKALLVSLQAEAGVGRVKLEGT